MTEEQDGREDPQGQDGDGVLEEILRDPAKRREMVRLLGLEERRETVRTPSGKEDGLSDRHTPSGTNPWPGVPSGNAAPLWWPPSCFPPFYPPPQAQPMGNPCPPSNFSAAAGLPQPQQPRKRPAPEEDEESQDIEDHIDLLSDTEALDLVEFDPSVEPEDAWPPPKAMETFLDKHFNRSLSDSERKAIMKDFPKPSSKALEVPRLDEQVKDHLKGKGKDPHFGSEKTLFKLQESLLDVAGPLTCLWGDLLNKEATTSKEDILLLVQRTLVLLGSVSHSISQERRKVVWTKINPKYKSLGAEDYGKRDSNLFGPGFLEKAAKRLEADKAIAKVSYNSAPAAKRAKFSRDRSDLRSFLAKGAPARYGGGQHQRHQPYRPPGRFQSKRYFQQNKRPQSQSHPGPSKPPQDQQ